MLLIWYCLTPVLPYMVLKDFFHVTPGIVLHVFAFHGFEGLVYVTPGIVYTFLPYMVLKNLFMLQTPSS